MRLVESDSFKKKRGGGELVKCAIEHKLKSRFLCIHT